MAAWRSWSVVSATASKRASDFPVATRARQVIDLARGLTMHAQLGAPRNTLLKDAEEAADLVLLPSLKYERPVSL
ncbi:hypothetical protein KX729_31715 [Rhizobium sp. XQZ8]|uniref:hypothetical protein n=1 Tax=Rhizobium populisoli TaxID=2859785 RepID=UPI001CA5B1EA|nr:hypothetical protein [Rhizobium populisoli]MBW6425955.1 hypothetical protein [Rhizobium populisoli]